MTLSLNKKDIEDLLPHREPMLLIDGLKDIKKLHSATAIMNVKKDGFYVQGSYLLTGETRGYKWKGAIFDKVKPKGKNGAVELVLRY